LGTRHIKGHQDARSPLQTLTREARLNVEVDRTATAYWIHLVEHSETMPQPVNHNIYEEEWQIWNGEQKIIHPSVKTLYSLIQDQITETWWSREGHISSVVKKEIDYDATEMMMERLQLHQRRYVTKTASENCGVGTTLLKWKFQDTAECPRCSHPQEDTVHIQQCEGHDADLTFLKSVQTMGKFLSETQTRPDLQDAIIECLQRWRKKLPIQLNQYQKDVRAVIKSQHAIEWMDFLEGLPAKGWRALQHNNYRDEHIKKSSRKWIRELLLKLHQMGHKQWKHRCHVKANITRPQEKAGISLLHNMI
jgi:hypothetical protein